MLKKFELSSLRRALLLLFVVSIIGVDLKAQHPIIDESGLDLGYVTTYDFRNKSFFYDFTFDSGQSYPTCLNGTNEVGKINYDTTYLKVSHEGGSCTNKRELLDIRLWTYGTEYEDWFKPMVFKKVYYGDTDASVIIKEPDLIVTGKPLNEMPFYVFSVYDKLDEGKFLSLASLEFCFFSNCTSGSLISYNTFRTRRKYGTTESISGSQQKYNYVFKVSDWSNNSFLGNLEYSIDRGSDYLKRLNQGVEVYIVSKYYRKGTYDGVTYDGNREYRVQSLRTIVYPKKPGWKIASIPTKICRGSVIDLRTWVDMKGLPFSGKFEVISGGNTLIEGGYNLNTENVTGFVSGKKELTIRCYPYFKENVSTSGGYPENMWNVYMDVKVMVYDRPTISDNGVQIICSSSAITDLIRCSPSGGIYSGSYVSTNKLNVPGAVASSIYNVAVKYEYTDGNGCKSEYTYDQEITAIPSINFNLPTSVCKETKINLYSITTPAGGVFSGDGVDASGDFNPVVAGIGSHSITYAVGGVCPASQTKTVTVNELQPENIVVSSVPKQCKDGLKIDLMPFVNYAGGSFSGPGIEGSRYFNPATAAVGLNNITYTVGNSTCRVNKTFTIEVANSVAVSFSAISRICEAKEVNLNSHVSVSGGTFNGPGVTGNTFNSEAAGIGTHTVFYTISSGGCSGTASTNIVVADLLPSNVYFETIPRMCKSDVNGFVDLRNYLKNHSGGSFSGSGVEGNYFYPSRANVGNNVIYYNYGVSVCTKSVKTEVIVNDKDNISFYKVPTVCKNTTIDLMQYVTPQGGEFFGPGVSGKRYFNSGATGTGKFTITYRYFNGNCYGETSQEISVDAILPSNIVFDDLPTTCKSGDAINLREYVNTSLGTFSGNGVVSEYLNPSSAVVGINVINLTIQEGSCKSTYSNTVKILKDPTIIFNDMGDVCSDLDIELINFVYPYGGTFSGSGVSGTIFKPSLAGMGETYINYSYSGEGGCSSVVSKKVKVNGLLPITVKFNKVDNLCPNQNAIDLSQYVEPKTGYFTGTGIVGNMFDPRVSGSGTFLVKYTVESGSCKREVSQTITVKSPLPTIFNDIPVVCKDDAINLENYVFPTGGSFSGSGVTGTTFNPEVAGVGESYIYYSLNMDGCNTITSKKVTVRATVKDFSFNASRTMCKNDDPVDLWGDVVGYGGTNGSFSGNGIVGSIFNPTSANIGGNLVKFTISENGCVFDAVSTITILQSPSVTFNAIGDVCKNEEIELTTYVNPTGGSFSGSGVTGTKFNPSAAGLGTKYIFYQYTGANGCKETKQQAVNVKALLPSESSIVISAVPNLCETDNPINLRDYINRTDGSFVGSGVVGNQFDPRVSGTGTFVIKYVNSSGTCKVEREFSITVLSTPIVIFNDIANICKDDAINLENYVFPTGGSFSGSGVTGTTFNPEVAGVGESYIYYSLNMDGCNTITSKKVTVRATVKDFSFNASRTMCKNDDPVDLWGDVVGYGGTNGSFSGNGIVGSIFNPTSANIGGNLVKFTISENGCVFDAVSTITILQSPSVTFNAIGDVCKNEEIELTTYVNPTGGSFSGSGVTGTKFNPSAAGLGTKYIFYQYTGANGCKETKQQAVNVKALLPSESSIVISAVPNLCETDNPINLRDYINRTDGYFSGTGIVGNMFDPRVSGSGSFEIRYINSSGSCKVEKSFSIVVLSSPSVIFNAIPNICFEGKIPLNDYVYPKGGVFSGSGIQSDTLNVKLAGVGTHNIYYTYSAGGCSKSVSKTVNISAVIPNFSIKDIPSLCKNGDPIELRGYIDGYSGNNGSFSGKGIVGGVLNPSQADIGGNLIKYTVVEGGCSREAVKTITVVANPQITFNTIPLVCNDNLIDLSKYVFPTGGSFSGSGITGNSLNPNDIGVGDTYINYRVEGANGCYSIAQQKVSVGALIPGSLQFSDPGMICKLGKEINLRNFVNTDYGVFSGNGVVGDYFYPNNATIGSNSIKFSIIQGSCKAEKERLILVKDDGELLFSEIPALCYKTPIDLSNYVYPKGGVFRGSGISGNMFNPEVAGIGRHKIIYDVLSESGCTSTLERTIEVKNLYTAQENIAVNLVNDICLNSPAVDLRQFVSPLGGYFSGPGIIGNMFDPSVAGLGIHQVYYTIGQVDCNQSKGFTVRVIGNGTVSVEQIPLVCGSDLNLADYVNPSGGTFTGKYVVNGVFKGENAPTDTFTVKYNVSTDEGCTVSKDIRVSNYKMPSINIGVSEANIQPGGVIQFIPQGLSGNLDMYSYSWTFGDGGWSVEQKPWHYYYHRGVFDVGFRLNVKTNECYKEYKEQGALSVTDENGRKIFFKGRLIYEEISEKEIALSPNPFTEGINLEGVSEDASVMLFDITGREVKRWTGGGYIQLNELKPGIYILQIKGSSKKFKLVKQ